MIGRSVDDAAWRVKSSAMVPSIGELMLPSLAAIGDAGGEATNDQIRETVACRLALSSDAVARTHGPKGTRTELEYRLAWARTRLAKHGWLEPAGPRRWRLTTSGWAELTRARTTASESQ